MDHIAKVTGANDVVDVQCQGVARVTFGTIQLVQQLGEFLIECGFVVVVPLETAVVLLELSRNISCCSSVLFRYVLSYIFHDRSLQR